MKRSEIAMVDSSINGERGDKVLAMVKRGRVMLWADSGERSGGCQRRLREVGYSAVSDEEKWSQDQDDGERLPTVARQQL